LREGFIFDCAIVQRHVSIAFRQQRASEITQAVVQVRARVPNFGFGGDEQNSHIFTVTIIQRGKTAVN
jgi:hypothetical protein